MNTLCITVLIDTVTVSSSHGLASGPALLASPEKTAFQLYEPAVENVGVPPVTVLELGTMLEPVTVTATDPIAVPEHVPPLNQL
jgi:hypothetical protein